MRTLPLSEAKAHLSELIDAVDARHERVTITRRGRPAAVLMSHEEMEGLEATLEIMADPAFYAEILRNQAELDAGGGREYTLDELFGTEEDRGTTTASAGPRGKRGRRAKAATRPQAAGARGAGQPSERRAKRRTAAR